MYVIKFKHHFHTKYLELIFNCSYEVKQKAKEHKKRPFLSREENINEDGNINDWGFLINKRPWVFPSKGLFFDKFLLQISVQRKFVKQSTAALVSLEQIGDSSLFGGKYKGQNSLFLAFLWGFYVVEPQNSTKKIHFIKFFWTKTRARC